MYVKQHRHTSFFNLFGAILRLGAILLFGFPVPTRTCADAHLKAPPAQNNSPMKKTRSTKAQNAFQGQNNSQNSNARRNWDIHINQCLPFPNTQK